jgi:hypothetical protein
MLIFLPPSDGCCAAGEAPGGAASSSAMSQHKKLHPSRLPGYLAIYPIFRKVQG